MKNKIFYVVVWAISVVTIILYCTGAAAYVNTRFKSVDFIPAVLVHSSHYFNTEQNDAYFSGGNAFRNTTWRMTREDIKLAEGKDPVKETENAIFFTNVDFYNHPSTVSYVFDELTKRVVVGMYTLDTQAVPKERMRDAYFDIVSVLINLYGTPVKARAYVRGDISPTADEVEKGNAYYLAEWECDGVAIRCLFYLRTDNEGNSSLVIQIPYILI
ncbi:MAG TPA: hypothetical protein GXX17_07165 [Clostridiales bacterium]|nr:hypothetical protein [Clostridiales bacterium]